MDFPQQVLASCAKGDDAIVCSGTTYIKDDLLAFTSKNGSSILNEGEGFADGAKGVGLVGTGDWISITNTGL